MSDFLAQFVSDFAVAMKAVDSRRPVAPPFQPGIGPHPEDSVVSMCMDELSSAAYARYGAYSRGVSYPGSRAKCDLCFGAEGMWSWAVEMKLLRFLGDNGKPNGNMLMHILSPYARDRSALTDCSKLVAAAIAPNKAVVIFGYHHEDWPLEPAIEAFELLAGTKVALGQRHSAIAHPLVHPVHSSGRVFGWTVSPR